MKVDGVQKTMETVQNAQETMEMSMKGEKDYIEKNLDASPTNSPQLEPVQRTGEVGVAKEKECSDSFPH